MAGCLGWFLLALGLFLLIDHYLGLSLLWALIAVGAACPMMALRPGGTPVMVLPGTVLVTTAAALLGRAMGIVSFPSWQIWAILFGAAGLGLMLVWAVSGRGRWTVIPGGLLLFVAGASLGTDDFHRWQRWLREVANMLPLLLVLLGVLVIVNRWRRRSVKGGVTIEDS